MNEIINSGAVTMTSREIADLVESRHDGVKLCIERLVLRGVISQPSMKDGIKSANGITETIYLVTKRDSYIIGAQLSPEFTARLVDRWQALELAQEIRVPTTLAGALRLAAEQAEQIESQALQLAAPAPAVAFVDQYVDATGLLGFRQALQRRRGSRWLFRWVTVKVTIYFLTPYIGR